MGILKKYNPFKKSKDTVASSEILFATPSGLHSDISVTEVMKKVRSIEIKTKGLSNHIFSGEYHSAFKGRGMSFSEVREYAYGDDVRDIDWNVTARFKSPFVKVFEEERELTLMLMVDISASSLFGSKQSKRDIMTEICSVLSFSAISNNDKVGVIFFSDKIERFIPPKKGKGHILFIIRELITMQPHYEAQTNIEEAFRYLNSVLKKRTITFVLSDFLSKSYTKALTISAKRHDLVGIHLYDPLDKQLPNVGMIQIKDAERKSTHWIDTSDENFRKKYESQFINHEAEVKSNFRLSGADFISISTQQDYVKALQVFFKSRI